MSVWTHVAGIIRVDSLRLPEDYDHKKELEELLATDEFLGKQFGFYDNWDDYDEKTNPIPCGSEGTVRYSVIENISGDGSKSSLAAFQIVIWGDLRDYDDKQAVIDWFRNACEKLFVRQAVITVETYIDDTEVFDYNKYKFEVGS